MIAGKWGTGLYSCFWAEFNNKKQDIEADNIKYKCGLIWYNVIVISYESFL